jgi:biotin carboxylase
MPESNTESISSLYSLNPVVVVGTTPDYVARISRHYPHATLFILDFRHQNDPFLKGINTTALFFASLSDQGATLRSFQQYLSTRHISPMGIACFDCEYLVLASRLAADLHLPFPPVDAVLHSRNKLETRRLLKEAGIPSISAVAASGMEKTLHFFHTTQNPVVIKPLSGSGSELVFFCRNEDEIIKSVKIMKEQLPRRKENPLFYIIPSYDSKQEPSLDRPFLDPCQTWLVEEYIPGPEYSCDFILSDDRVTIIRETGKVTAPDQTFGSVLAYTCPPTYPKGFSSQTLLHALGRACKALGFSWGYFMVDFIVQDLYPFIIELSPRPGGDSIPDLIKSATGCDTLDIYLDLVCGRPVHINPTPLQSRYVGSLNLYAPCKGRITSLDVSEMQRQQVVKGIYLKKKVGNRITLPPDDYDNRLLGYCIVSLDHSPDPIALHQRLQPLLRVSIEN